MGLSEVLCREDLEPGRAIMFVDALGRLSRPLVRHAASSGRLVIFGEAIHRVRETAWFQEAVGAGHLRQFSYHPFHAAYEYWRADDVALDAVEAVYEALKFRGKVPAAPLFDLYKDARLETAFKKNLVLQLAAFFRTAAALSMLTAGGRAVQFYPSASWEEVRQWLDFAGISWERPKGAEITRAWRALLVRRESSFERLKWAGVLAALPVWVLSGMRKIVRTASPAGQVQVALRVYGSDWGFLGEETRKIDWLLDNHQLHKENALFVVEKPVSEEYRAEFVRRGYRFEDVSGSMAFRRVTAGFLFSEFISRALSAWVRLLVAVFHSPAIFMEVAARGWLEYLRWTAFLERWRPRHYVAYNHFHYDHVFRNSLLRAAGCESWYYVHSVNYRCAFHAAPDRPPVSQIDWAYLEYDHETHWELLDKELYRRVHGRSRNYHLWGPLWSAHIQPESHVTALVAQRKAVLTVESVVAAFDTGFGLSAPYEENDIREFFEALAAMFDHPNWASRLLLFKSKNYLEHFRSKALSGVLTSLERLLKHPRCISLDAAYAPGAVIAEADLTVSLAFTSPTVEALGARRRAFYYDPNGKFRESYYERFPNLVAHDRQSLASLCEYWLRMSDADFQKYLDRYIAPEFGGYLDSGAVARFREALSIG